MTESQAESPVETPAETSAETLAPKTIAVLGASADRAKFGNKCVRCYLDVGWTVFPVNPGAEEIEGLPVFKTLVDIPRDLDRIAVYLPPPVTESMLEALAKRDAGDVYFNPGSADRSIVDRAIALGVRAVDGCAIVAVGRVPAMYP